jgi:hypothetical protein
MKTWESGGIAPPFLASALDVGVWSASRPGLFIPKEIAPITYWIGGWVGPKVGLDSVKKIKILPLPIIECPARFPSLYRLSYGKKPQRALVI